MLLRKTTSLFGAVLWGLALGVAIVTIIYALWGMAVVMTRTILPN